MPVDRVDGCWGVIDSNDFNLFTWYFRKLFRKERIHLLGMRCRGKSEGKDKYREDQLLHVMHRFCPFADVLRYRKVRLRQTVNGRANCRFRGIFVEQFNSIARFKISHCTPLSLRSSIAKTRDVK